MKRTTKHLALGAAVLGGAYCLWKRHENPAWTPWASLLSSPRDKALALEKVKVTSVPTPHETAALDPGMSTDQVKAVNTSLSSETDMKKLANHAVALGAVGHDNSAAAVAAKTVAVAEAKAQGAKDVELHVKQVEAAAVPVAPAVATGFGGHGWGERGHGWDGRGWDRRGHREPWHEPWGQQVPFEAIDPATGLPYVPAAVVGIQSGPAIVGIQSGPAIVGFEHFGRGHEFGRGRGREFGRGFGRDPRFPRDRFARQELELEPWRHHHHRHHEEVLPEQQYVQPQQQYVQPQQQVVQQPVVQPVAVPVADDDDAAADVAADVKTGSWWWS